MKPGKGPARAWDTGIMRRGVSELNLVTPHPSPLLPAVSQGLRHCPNPRKNGSGLPDLAQESVGKVGRFGSPPRVRVGCKAWGGAGLCGEQQEGSGQSVPEPQRGVGVEERENGSVWDHEPARKNSGITALWMLPSHLCSQSIPSGKFCTSPRL